VLLYNVKTLAERTAMPEIEQNRGHTERQTKNERPMKIQEVDMAGKNSIGMGEQTEPDGTICPLGGAPGH
jgi:hypothetical protein